MKKDLFIYQDSISKYKLNSLLRDNEKGSKINRPKCFYPFYISFDMNTISLEKETESCIELYPITPEGQEKSWIIQKVSARKYLEKGDIVAKEESNRIMLYYKNRKKNMKLKLR